MQKNNFLTLISLLLIGFSTSAATLTTPSIKATNLFPSIVKTTENFSLTYILFTDRGRRILNPTGIMSLYSYQDSNCLVGNLKVGEDIDLAVSAIGSYNIGIPGVYYLKPSISGFTGNCVGPLTINSALSLNTIKFEKLDLAKTGETGSIIKVKLSWMNNESILAKTSTDKATFFISQNQNCLNRIAGSRLTTASPQNGIYSISVTVPNLTPIYACAYAYSGQTKINAQALELRSSCSPPQILINGVCGSCPTGTALISGKCVSTVKNCEINNGFGTSSLNIQTLTWGDCILSGCNTGYHLVPDQNACDLDNRTCEIENGIGRQYWEFGAWGLCSVESCNSGFHLSGNSCDWSEEQCSNDVCVISFLNCSSGVCRRTTQSVPPGTPGATCFRGPLGTRIWSNGSWGPCVENRFAACTDGATGMPLPGYHIENGACMKDSQSCSVFVSSIVNINFNNNFQSSHSGYATGKKYWNQSSGTYSSCNIESCPNGSHLENGQCLGNRKNARKEGFMGSDGCYFDVWSSTTNSYYKFKLDQYLYGKSISDGTTIATLCPILQTYSFPGF